MLVTKLIILLVGLLGGGYQVYHCYKYHKVKRIFTDNQPLLTLQKVFQHITAVMLVVWLFFPCLVIRATLPVVPMIEFSGDGIMLLGLSLWLWSQATLGINWSGRVGIQQDGHTLIKTGPYRWLRHPMYTAFILIVFGAILAVHNWLVMLPYLIFEGLVVARAAQEESLLEKRFSDEYRQYKKKTWRYFPFIW